MATAAGRAGGGGVLSLDDAGDPGLAAKAIGRLARLSRGDCGIRLGLSALPSVDAIVAGLPDAVKTGILVFRAGDLERRVRVLADRGITGLLEVTSIDEAGQAVEAVHHRR